MRDIIKKTRTTSFATSKNPEIEKKLIIGLSVLVIFLGVAYGYFIKQTIVNIVAVEDIAEKTTDLGSEVSSLEVKYIELKNRIDLDFAYLNGYKEARNVKFVSRNTLSKALTLGEN